MSVDGRRTDMPVLSINGRASWDSDTKCPYCSEPAYDRTPGPYSLSPRGSDAALCEFCADETWPGAWQVVNSFNGIREGLDRAEPVGRLVLGMLLSEVVDKSDRDGPDGGIVVTDDPMLAIVGAAISAKVAVDVRDKPSARAALLELARLLPLCKLAAHRLPDRPDEPRDLDDLLSEAYPETAEETP